MIKNYFKTAWRNIKSHKSYAAINIFGLGIGIAASLLIFLVIHYEMTYDNFETNKDKICRVVTNYTNVSNGEVNGHESAVPLVLPDALKADFPQLKISPVWNIGGAQMHIPVNGSFTNEKLLKENDGLYFAEPALFKMFDYTWLTGNANRLNEPHTCVLNESLANEFFGDWKKAIGQTIQMWSYRVPLQVVGVFKDLPHNTDMEVKMGASYSTFRQFNDYTFTHPDWQTSMWPNECFLLLPDNSNPAQYTSQLQGFVKKYFPAIIKRMRLLILPACR